MVLIRSADPHLPLSRKSISSRLPSPILQGVGLLYITWSIPLCGFLGMGLGLSLPSRNSLPPVPRIVKCFPSSALAGSYGYCSGAWKLLCGFMVAAG